MKKNVAPELRSGAQQRAAPHALLNVEREQAIIRAMAPRALRAKEIETKALRAMAQTLAPYNTEAAEARKRCDAILVAVAQRQAAILAMVPHEKPGPRVAVTQTVIRRRDILEDLGLTTSTAAKVEKIGALPPKVVDEYLATEDASRAGLLRLAAAESRKGQPPKTHTNPPGRTVEPEADADPWDESFALIEAVEAIGRITDAWPKGRSRARLVTRLREIANKVERWDADEFGETDGLHTQN